MKTCKPALWAFVLAALFTAAPVVAQPADYPSKPITMVVGFPPGGISDVLARALAARLTQQMGQNVVVDNKPGAATTVASAYVANAAPDGYTIQFQDITTHAINAAAYKKLRYDSWNDFSWISLVASTPLMLVSSLSSGAKDVQGLVSLLKSRPGELAYASSGNGAITHLSGEYFKSLAGVNALHVPYRGGTPATQAVLAGEVVYTFSTMPPALPNVKGGKLYGLAVTSGRRVGVAPNVPTLKEVGVPLEILLYSGIMGPKGMPSAVVERLGAEIRKALASPEMKRTLANVGAEDMASSSAEFVALTKVESEKMALAVKFANVVLD